MTAPVARRDEARYSADTMAKLEECPHPRCDHRNPVGAKACGLCKRLFADNPVWLNVLVGLLACIALLWGMTGS